MSTTAASNTPTPTPASAPDFNPMAGKVNEKTYAGGGTTAAPVVDIPEPSFAPPPLDLTDEAPLPEEGGSKKEGGKKSEGKPGPAPFNQEMNELSDPEKKKAAEQSAAFIMNIYKAAHHWGNGMIQISDKKISRLQMEGEINLSVGVPYAHHGFISLGEFIQEYNNQAGEVLTVEPEFEEAVLPPLTRVLAKKGMGMTDENYLMFMFGTDIVKKGQMIYSMKRQTREILQFAKDQTANGRTMRNQPTTSLQAVRTEAAAPAADSQEQPAPAPVHEAPVVPITGTTLQEKALASVSVEADRTGLPTYGDPDKVRRLDEVMQLDAKEQRKVNNARKTLGKELGTPKPRRKKGTGVPGAAEPRRQSGKNPGGAKK